MGGGCVRLSFPGTKVTPCGCWSHKEPSTWMWEPEKDLSREPGWRRAANRRGQRGASMTRLGNWRSYCEIRVGLGSLALTAKHQNTAPVDERLQLRNMEPPGTGHLWENGHPTACEAMGHLLSLWSSGGEGLPEMKGSNSQEHALRHCL